MLTITITGETPEDVKNQLIAFDKALTPGGKSGKTADAAEEKPKKKAAEDDEQEEKPKKSTKKVSEDEAEEKAPTHEDARAAIVSLAKKLDWDPAPPKIQAFTKKFAKKHDLTDEEGELIQRVPQIPVKKLKLFLEAIKEEGDV